MNVTRPQLGFTLIEMLVSLSLFTVIITITVGSLLVLINGNRELVNSQSIMDSLAFSMDSMTREIRTGRAYYCAWSSGETGVFGSNGHESIGTSTRDCAGGKPGTANGDFHGVSVIESGDSITGSSASRILYYYQASAGTTPGTIMRRVGNEDAQSIFSSGINITDANFYVTGSRNLMLGNAQQPTVTIVLSAADVNDPTNPITLQTTITQREIDL